MFRIWNMWPIEKMETGGPGACLPRGAFIWLKNVKLFATRAGGKHHAFRHTKAHLARCQVGNHNSVFADQVFRRIR